MASSRSPPKGPRWYHRPGEGGRAHGGGQGLESSVRGRAARASRRAPGLQDLGAPDRSPSAGAVALSQQRAGHLLRPPGPAAPLTARPQGRTNGGEVSAVFLVLQGLGEYDYVPLT